MRSDDVRDGQRVKLNRASGIAGIGEDDIVTVEGPTEGADFFLVANDGTRFRMHPDGFNPA